MPERLTPDASRPQGNDRPPIGSPRIDSMVEVVYELTSADLRQIPLCELDDYLAGVCLAIAALPCGFLQTQWIKLLARRFAVINHDPVEDLVAELASRVVDERESWAQEKLVHYPELTR